jgi:hypothetical protein
LSGLVRTLNALARTDLELPLGRHDLSVGTGDVHTSVQAGLVVGLDDITLHNLAAANTAVVRSLTTDGVSNYAALCLQGQNLRSRETASGPAEGTVVNVKESVLLLETEPRHVLGISLHHLVALMAVVVLVGGAVGVPALGEDDDVGGPTERIGEDGARSEVDIRVVTRSLLGRGTVKVPDGKVLGLVLLLVEGLSSHCIN